MSSRRYTLPVRRPTPVILAAVTLWLLALLVMECQILGGRFLSEFHIYAQATQTWWRGEEIYEPGINGFLYLPVSAVLFTPWAYLPPLIGDSVWRLSLTGVGFWGVWRLAGLVATGEQRTQVFGVALIVAMPMAVVDVRGAQTELLMLGLMLGGLADIAERRWRRAACLLVLAAAFKPQALALLLLAGALWPALRPPLLTGLVALLAVPLIHWHPAFALSEYASLVRKTLDSANPGHGVWHDYANALSPYIDIPLSVQTLTRAAAGVATLVVARLVVTRTPPRAAAAVVAALIVIYTLLFNPRTVLGHYGDMALVAGVFAGWERLVRRNIRLSWLLVALCFGLTTHAWSRDLHHATTIWLKPLLAGGFGLYALLRLVPPVLVPPSLALPQDIDHATGGE